MASQAAKKLWVEALRLAAELDRIGDTTLTLGLEAIQLLGEQQQAGAHSRTRETYSEVMDSHRRFIHQMEELGRETDLLREQVTPTEFAQRIEKLLAEQDRVDVMNLADEELISLCNRAWKTIEDVPDILDVVVASTAIAHFALAHAHAEALNALLDHPPLDRQVFEGVVQLARAAALDLGGAVFPFLGTLETLFELATPQIERDAESMRNASAVLDRLFAFGDQLDLLGQSADLAQANARAAGQVVTKANLDFEKESRLLIEVFEAARS